VKEVKNITCNILDQSLYLNCNLKETIRLKIVKTEKHIILEYLFKHVKMYNFIDLGILIFDESKFNSFLL
jgi:hypothetical protein